MDIFYSFGFEFSRIGGIWGVLLLGCRGILRLGILPLWVPIVGLLLVCFLVSIFVFLWCLLGSILLCSNRLVWVFFLRCVLGICRFFLF